MTVFRSAAERRALLWCLAVGLLAVALGVIQGVAPRRIWIVLWSMHLDFWLGAMIVALDAVLVIAGGRGSLLISMASIGILGALCMATVAVMLVVGFLVGG